MSIPSVRINFIDGGLGIISPGPGGAQAAVGVSLSGTVNTVYACGTSKATQDALSGGPLCEAVAAINDVAGTPVYAVPCPIVTAGTVGAWTQVGSGAGVVSATVGPHVEVDIKCSTAGALGTSAFQFAVNGGTYGTPVASVAGSTWVYRVPGTFLVVTFAAATYRLDDVYSFFPDGTTSATSGAPATVTGASSPVDAYAIKVAITLAGARGTAQFTYSLDGGALPTGNDGVVSPSILTAATYAIPGTGVILAFSNAAYVAGDTYTATATPPSTDNTAIGAAIDALLASQFVFEGVHVVGTPSSAANAATLATAVDSKMTSAATNQRFLFSVIECPQSESDATIMSGFANFVSSKGRIAVTCGDVALVSTITGLSLKRNLAWVLCPRIASAKLSENPGKVLLGALPNVVYIYRNEDATPGLTDARFTTVRTLRGKTGYFITDAPTMASSTSDYSSLMNVRVANRAATIAAQAYTDYLNADVRINKSTGYIDERDAVKIDASVTAQLRSELQGTPGSSTDEVSDVTATLSRTDNLLSNPIGNAVVAIIPKATLRSITVNLGFRNPQLTA